MTELSEPWCIPAGEGNECVICEGDDPNKPGNIVFVVRAPMGLADRHRISHEFLAEQAALVVKAVNALRAPPAQGEPVATADLAEVLENVRASIAKLGNRRDGHIPIELHKACQALAHMTKDSA